MSQNLKKKAFLEHRKIRQAQQRVNRTNQKLNALYGNIRPGKAIAQTNSSHPQNTCFTNPQSTTQISGNSCINTHSYTQGHGVNLDQLGANHENNPYKQSKYGDSTTMYLKNTQSVGDVENNKNLSTQQTHDSNNQHSLNRKAANETWKNPCHATQDHIRPNQPNPRDTKNKSERKLQYARDNQIPGPSKTHTIEELKEIRQAIENFDLTLTNIHPSYKNPPEFEETRILPKGKQPLRGPPKGKSTENTVPPSIYNTPTPTSQSQLTTQHRNTNKRKSPNNLQSTTRKRYKTTEENEPNNNNTLQHRTPPGSHNANKEDKTKTKIKSKDYHPSYLTLYIHYPITPNKQLSDSAIILELQKHKKRTHTN
ncbi:hypothetical protein CHS0354_001921 [Potamilus streckersoni]|uniref:Uncharacterized protein n=1 Tax=Potamilus streckersoni TaxID=2493646 RepID=A0AAE0SAX4_9BIVA|nr:hypothetical protein CHS0354_001921 [Potamilus streckersoni]